MLKTLALAAVVAVAAVGSANATCATAKLAGTWNVGSTSGSACQLVVKATGKLTQGNRI